MDSLGIDKKQEKSAPTTQSGQREILPAEKRFNNRLYWGLNYGIQVTTAVLGSYWIKYGGGKKYFDKAAEWAGTKVIPKITSKTGAKAIEESNTYLVGATQLMIGNLFFIPIKWYENRKPQIVRKIDAEMIKQQEKQGFIITPEERQRHEDALQALEKEPRANWFTLGAARAAGISSFFVANWLIGEERASWMRNKFAGGVATTLKSTNIKPLEKLGHSKKTERFLKLAFIDFFYSIFVANSVFQVTKFLTPRQKNDRKQEVSTQPTNESTEPAVTSQQAETSFADKHPRKQPKHITPHEKFTDYVSATTDTERQVTI